MVMMRLCHADKSVMVYSTVANVMMRLCQPESVMVCFPVNMLMMSLCQTDTTDGVLHCRYGERETVSNRQDCDSVLQC